MPLTSRPAWHAIQMEYSDLRRTHSQLTQCTRPSKKQTNVGNVKRYLQKITMSRDGLLIVTDHAPFHPQRERIVVPRQILDGILTTIHIRFAHPSKHQTKSIFNRYFFALDIDRGISNVTSACYHCESVKSLP